MKNENKVTIKTRKIMIHKFSRYLLTLVALLALTAGAWATEEYESFDLSSGNTNVNGTHFNITGTSGMNDYGLFLSSESVTVTSLNGENITRVEFIIGLGKSKAENITGTPGTNSCTNGNENGSITDINATSVTLSTENSGYTSVSIKQITVYYGNSAPAVEVTTNAASEGAAFTEAWFNMPAFDATAEYELVRDLAVETALNIFVIENEEPVALTEDSRLRIAKNGDNGYLPVNTLTCAFIDGIENVTMTPQQIIAAGMTPVFYLLDENEEWQLVTDINLQTGLPNNIAPGQTYRMTLVGSEGSLYDGETAPSFAVTLYDTYDIATETSEHGTLTFTVDEQEVTAVEPGKTVTVTVEPDEGWITNVVTAAQTDETEVEVSGSENEWTLTMPEAEVLVSATYKKLLSNEDISVEDIAEETYTGSEIEPEITVMDGETALTLGTDYTVSYTNNVEAGTATVTITACESSEDYAGEITTTFAIEKASGAVYFNPLRIKKTTIDKNFIYTPSTVIGEGTLTYSTENKDVATVDPSTGEITIVGEGTTLVNAKLSGGKNYKGAIGWYELTVVAADVLILDETEDNTEVLEDVDGTAANVSLTRTLNADGWNTFAVPFDISSEELADMGMTAKELTGSSFFDGELTLNFADAESIEAGKPYLVKVAETVDNPIFSGAILSKEAVTIETEAVDFVPTLGKTLVTGPAGDEDNTKAVLFLGAGNKLVYPTMVNNPDQLSSYMKGFRAYFQLKGDTSLSIKSFCLDFGNDVVTGIVEVADEKPADGIWYDLNGRKLDGVPTQPGVYVVNGKKVVIR